MNLTVHGIGLDEEKSFNATFADPTTNHPASAALAGRLVPRSPDLEADNL